MNDCISRVILNAKQFKDGSYVQSLNHRMNQTISIVLVAIEHTRIRKGSYSTLSAVTVPMGQPGDNCIAQWYNGDNMRP